MGVGKQKHLRAIFIKYVVSLGLGIVLLLVTNYYIFFVNSFGIYPANYSEKTIQRNYEQLKKTPRVTIDLLTPMSSFGVYSNDGNYLYGSFSDRDEDRIWDNYIKGKMSYGGRNYLASIERDDGVLLVKYPLTVQYKNQKLRSLLPNAEIIIFVLSLIELATIIILLSNRFAKNINKDLASLLDAARKIEDQDLDFGIGTSHIQEINMVLQGMDKMKSSLKNALEKQWTLEQQQREQISALAHDIKTPLTIVKGNVELLRETNMTVEQEEYSNYIQKSSKQMEKYINSLLAITRKQIGDNSKSEDIDLVGLMGSLKEQTQALCNIKNMKISWEMEVGEDLAIEGYRDELERAIMNVIRNAIDYSYDNSNIVINSWLHNSELTIEVIDQGKGFSAKILRHAKEQFYMGDESRTKSGHNGLGLYIADNIIRKHRGHITLSNSKNGGAMVTIKIPIH